MYDFIIIGAGYGGLSSAALLAKLGFKTLVLEAHTEIGGCASYFKRKDFTFDVGATTLSALLANQPLGKLFNLLEIKPNLKKLDPGVVVYMDDKKITRYSDKTKWIQESQKQFPEGDHLDFWNKLYDINSYLWDLININHSLPPACIKDLLALVKISNLKFMPLIPGLFLPLSNILKKYHLNKNKDFIRFVDEQLLISTQNNSQISPYITSSIGLTYASETYYPYGGITKPLHEILGFYKSTKNDISFEEKVCKLEQKNGFYNVTTEKGTYQAKGVISNATIWDMLKITNGEIHKYFLNKVDLFRSSWGAFTLYFAIESNIKLETAYYQIHVKKNIPYCIGNSLFISFSLDDDYEKAPKGFKTVTISTHTNIKEWENLGKEEYKNKKALIEKAIMSEFDNFFPEFHNSEKIIVNSGSPHTFAKYTNRNKGFVGGIPHSIKKNFLQMPSNKTPFKNLYMVGDTSFAGQGIPAVVLGALNIYERLK